MTTLLVIIYLSFISLGLPDSLLGSAWPIIQKDLATTFSIAGYISMTTCAGTVISSLISNRMVLKFGTGKVTFVSVVMTGLALLGCTFAPNVLFLFAMALPLGLGAGSVDAALNNFVALHYESKHMSWLHCFWGIGATAGPAIMSIFLLSQGGWRKGYLTIAILQLSLALLLFFTLPLWNRSTNRTSIIDAVQQKPISNREAMKIPYVKLALVSFIFFCATELTTGLWSSSYLVSVKQVSPAIAARWAAYFYAGITGGRFISGFLSIKVKSPTLIRIGQLICVIGAITLMLPLPAYFSMIGIILLGLGTSPIYPSMLHETPNRFGAENSGAIMGLQMAFAYIGSTFAPPLMGAIASITTIKIFPYFLLLCVLTMLITSEILQKKIVSKNRVNIIE
ncbi:MFS transporter [Paludicola sp. MB14-C6]|uniref:MFS transporter n=1 Tax=Paludihabitans sp. MB14-C6 TaxID=3070656 RepID=UPI0027DB6FBE|nr:MFS transporter [Paludicola sp. MB14-C6]WMJ22317.1 MFS transporter [Paludicola sp. MB14-C6]